MPPFMPHAIARARSLFGQRRAGLIAVLLAGSIAVASLPSGVDAQGRGRVSLARDAEIEALVADYARPLIKAAGLRLGDVEIVLVNDNAFNAFVLGRRLFINTGTFLAAETPNEIIAVLAHEIAHIAGGHQERLRDQLARAKTQSLIAQLAGFGAVAAGAATKNGDLARAGQGIALGTSEGVKRNLLAYKRTEETAADRAAVRYLEATGQSPVGLQETFKRFEAARALSGRTPNPYLLSHPLPRDRMAAIDALVKASPYRERKDPADLQRRHDRARAKVAAYTAGPGAVQRILRDGDNVALSYGSAIETFLRGRPDEAVARIDTVIRSLPNDPYAHEMRGEILMKTGRATDAVDSFRRASRLRNDDSGILRAAIGNALLETNDPTRFADAIANLRRAVILDPGYSKGHRDLAKAFHRIGDVPAANLATAEAFYVDGRLDQAKVFAKRAQNGLDKGDPSWRRAQDIIDAG